MIIKNEPFLIEYNVRMGDPECQTILPILKTDLTEVILACCEKKLHKTKIEWHKKKSICIVLCSNGYPDKFSKNIEIRGINKIKTNKNNFIFHAGTSRQNGKIFAVGGRVLNFISISNDFIMARKKIINNLKKLNWSKGFYIKDIAFKVIE